MKNQVFEAPEIHSPLSTGVGDPGWGPGAALAGACRHLGGPHQAGWHRGLAPHSPECTAQRRYHRVWRGGLGDLTWGKGSWFNVGQLCRL